MMGPTTLAVISALLAPGALVPAGYAAPSAPVAGTSPADALARGRVRGVAVAPAWQWVLKAIERDAGTKKAETSPAPTPDPEP